MTTRTISFMDLFQVKNMTKFEKEWASGLTMADKETVAHVKSNGLIFRHLFDPVRKQPVVIGLEPILGGEKYMTLRAGKLPEDTRPISEVILSETGLLWVRTEGGVLILPPGLGTMRPVMWDLGGLFHIQCVAVVNSLLRDPSAPVPQFQELSTTPLPVGLMELLKPDANKSRTVPRKKLLKAAGLSK